MLCCQVLAKPGFGQDVAVGRKTVRSSTPPSPTVKKRPVVKQAVPGARSRLESDGAAVGGNVLLTSHREVDYCVVSLSWIKWYS